MNELDLELYEAYLDNTLDSEAKKAFEARLLDDTSFKESFEAYKETSVFLSEKYSDQEDLNAFENNLKNLSEEHFTKKTSSGYKTEIWKYAAAIVMLITIGGFFLMDNDQPQYTDFATYPTISLVQRGSGDPMAKKAENAFNNKSFEEATAYLNELLGNDPNNQELLLYRGIAQTETGNYQNAYKDLDEVASGSSVYKNEALWQKALGLLKQKNYNKCKLVLVEIPPSADEYNKAQTLLKKL
ncbi:hypothetical protein [Arenibacter troitsensis]|uniref:Uncharacterized protein n=1 Tax=Arenibacter troitsensis TaxID=188872 RepID=A0A1X7L0H5_9FLAO|nr:hypothetical protein [Arenibacter troitsensis]SMG47321.1 hypothetical protein SAMN03080602_03584 [Arenibacter troitsensis]